MTSKLFIFVHGAWHSAWCWERIALGLRAKGHRVLTPDLPGHGSQYISPDRVTFNNYVDFIAHLIQQQSEPVILVGHSMGGLVIAAVAGKIPELIQELVFIAAYIPKDGDSLLSISEHSQSHNVSPYMEIDKEAKEIRLISTPALKDIFFNCCDEHDADMALSKLQAQPLEPFLAEIKIGDAFQRIPKRVFVCKFDKALILADQCRMANAVVQEVIILDACHAAYYSAADELVDKLR